MSKSKNVPAYLALVVDILERSAALGLTVERDTSTVSTLPENRGYVFVRIGGGSASLIVPKHADGVKWCDSSMSSIGRDTSSSSSSSSSMMRPHGGLTQSGSGSSTGPSTF